jgi:hypothetical protein
MVGWRNGSALVSNPLIAEPKDKGRWFDSSPDYNE